MKPPKTETKCSGCNKYPKQCYMLAREFALCIPCLKIATIFVITLILED